MIEFDGMHLALDIWAYFVVALSCLTLVDKVSWGWRIFGIIGAMCWVGLIGIRISEYSGS